MKNYSRTYDKIYTFHKACHDTPHSDADIIYDVLRPAHRQSVLEVLTRAFVNEPSTAGQSIDRPTDDQWRGFIDFLYG